MCAASRQRSDGKLPGGYLGAEIGVTALLSPRSVDATPARGGGSKMEAIIIAVLIIVIGAIALMRNLDVWSR
jgi:hypothetical protein